MRRNNTGALCGALCLPSFWPRSAFAAAALGAVLAVGCASRGANVRNDAGPDAQKDGAPTDAAPQADGGVDVGKDLGPFDLWAGDCDPVAQNCPSGKICVLGCNVPGIMRAEFTCIDDPMGTAGHGESCKDVECKAGTICLGDSKVANCRKYCDLDTDCPAGKECTATGPICMKGDYPTGRLCAL